MNPWVVSRRSCLSLMAGGVMWGHWEKPLLGAEENGGTWNLQTRSRRPERRENQPDVFVEINGQAKWPAKNMAVIICDMWDNHWCQGAAQRVVELAEPLNRFANTARKQGAFIIHAPSSVVDFYAETPQRKLAQQAKFAKTPVPLSTDTRWGTCWCYPDAPREAELPIDDSHMGCDCATKCALPTPGKDPWTRQIKSIDILDGDAISHDGQEVFNLLAERQIEHVMLVGVHLNMCVLGRPFGIRQMVKLGKQVVLVRDLTDTMYNHEKKPFVSHFAGTDLVVEHVEKYWCPTITSNQLLGGADTFSRDAAHKR